MEMKYEIRVTCEGVLFNFFTVKEFKEFVKFINSINNEMEDNGKDIEIMPYVFNYNENMQKIEELKLSSNTIDKPIKKSKYINTDSSSGVVHK